MTDPAVFFGLNVRAWLIRNDMTQTTLAKKTGMTRSTVANIVNGKRVAALGSVIKILKVVPVPFEQLTKVPFELDAAYD